MPINAQNGSNRQDSEEIPFNQIQGIIENDFGNDITANSVFADILNLANQFHPWHIRQQIAL